MRIFPKRQWQSTMRQFPGSVSAGDANIEDAPVSIPYAGSHLTTFSYPQASYTFTVGNPVGNIDPTILPAGARIRCFQILMQQFPLGLTLDAATGRISGTPTSAKALQVYRIYAQAALSYVAEVTITVNP